MRRSLDTIFVGNENFKVWIRDSAGRLLYGNAPPNVVAALPGNEMVLRADDGAQLRGLRSRLDGTALEGAELIVAIGVKRGSQLLSGFATALILICAVWVTATVVLAAWAVRRSLASVRHLSAQAARIQPDNLALRLPAQGIDKELQEFAHTFNSTLGRVQLAYQQLESFNANVAHELRTPLATLINGTEVTLSCARSADELREVLASHLEELETLKVLVNDMLFLARADGGELALDLQDVQVSDEFKRVADYFEAVLDEAGLGLDQEGDAQVLANPGLLRRAIANLLSNAIKATPRGDRLRLECRRQDSQIVIQVRNPGIPIPAATLSRIFERFYRADDARSRRSEGHGLGLAIVRAIARMHGGHVLAESDERSTVVGFTLARKASGPRSAPHRRPLSVKPGA
jgi:two-component system, OmpR family, heavy metal sensor histidine kinase CusS